MNSTSKHFMRVEIYHLDEYKEPIRSGCTLDDCVESIKVDDAGNYIIAHYNIYTKEIEEYTVPKTKYAISINLYC